MGEFQTKVKCKTKDFQIVHKIILRCTRTSACDFKCNTTVYAYQNYRNDISIMTINDIMYISIFNHHLLKMSLLCN